MLSSVFVYLSKWHRLQLSEDARAKSRAVLNWRSGCSSEENPKWQSEQLSFAWTDSRKRPISTVRDTEPVLPSFRLRGRPWHFMQYCSSLAKALLPDTRSIECEPWQLTQ